MHRSSIMSSSSYPNISATISCEVAYSYRYLPSLSVGDNTVLTSTVVDHAADPMGSIAAKLWHSCERIVITLWRTIADKLWCICAHLRHSYFNVHIQSHCAQRNSVIAVGSQFSLGIPFGQFCLIMSRWEMSFSSSSSSITLLFVERTCSVALLLYANFASVAEKKNHSKGQHLFSALR